jgi:hypothetical protein
MPFSEMRAALSFWVKARMAARAPARMTSGLPGSAPSATSILSINDRMMSMACGRVASSVRRAGSLPTFSAYSLRMFGCTSTKLSSRLVPSTLSRSRLGRPSPSDFWSVLISRNRAIAPFLRRNGQIFGQIVCKLYPNCRH